MIEVISCGPMVTVQDDGRPGHLAQGLACGGAADPTARTEAAALLAVTAKDLGAGIEMPGAPLQFLIGTDILLALTGAPMAASVDARPLAWGAAHPLVAGSVLTLRPRGEGTYSYVHVPGGLHTPAVLGSRATHLAVGIGRPLRAGDILPCAASTGSARRLAGGEDRMGGGELRLVPTPQTRLFPLKARERFEATTFRRDLRGNRQGVRLASDGKGFATGGQLTLLSDFVLPGDVQMTGDGIPYILGPECQTTGGYPRIGTVIRADLARAMQAPPGVPIRFRFVTVEDARGATSPPPRTEPLVRAPGEVQGLLGMQLVGGVVSAHAAEGEA